MLGADLLIPGVRNLGSNLICGCAPTSCPSTYGTAGSPREFSIASLSLGASLYRAWVVGMIATRCQDGVAPDCRLYEDLDKLTGGPHIRLLTVLAGDPSADRVECTLSTRRLEDPAPYQTLSYVWGDPAQTKPITCNGREVRITANLLAALRRIRKTSRPVTIWIDALCINQDDVAERASQVMLMERLYRRAAKTIVWLGPGTTRTPRTVTTCQRLQSIWSRWDDMSLEERQAVELKEDTFEDVLDLLDAPWWRRVWVVQELCLSADPVLFVGEYEMRWDTVAASLNLAWALFRAWDEWLANPHEVDRLKLQMQLSRFLNAVWGRGFYFAFMMVNMRERVQIHNGTPPSLGALDALLDLLLRFQPFGATDQRDKVFSLLGLADLSSHGVRPDYSTDVVDCYTKAAHSIVKTSRKLSILGVAAPGGSPARVVGLPTWVPDWSYSPAENRPMDLFASLLRLKNPEGVPAAGGMEAQPQFMGHSRRVLRDDDVAKLGAGGAGILNVPGRLIDSVVDVSDILHPLPSQFDDRPIIAKGVLATTLDSWRSFARSHAPYPSGESWQHVLCATASRGWTLQDDLDGWTAALEALLHDMLPAAGGVRRAFLDWPLRAWPAMHRTVAGRRLQRVLDRSMHDFLGVFAHAFDCRLARTAAGNLALIPGAGQRGDRIAVLAGGEWAYVVRTSSRGPRPDWERHRGQERWEYVGECYVYGIKAEQAWKEDECSSIHLV